MFPFYLNFEKSTIHIYFFFKNTKDYIKWEFNCEFTWSIQLIQVNFRKQQICIDFSQFIMSVYFNVEDKIISNTPCLNASNIARSIHIIIQSIVIQKFFLHIHKLYIDINWSEGNQDAFSNAKMSLTLIFTFFLWPKLAAFYSVY